MIMLGDVVTLTREIGDDLSVVSGRVSGIVLNDNGDIKYAYIKGVDSSFWMSDGWRFEEEIEEGNDDE